MLVNLTSLHHHPLGSIQFNLLSCCSHGELLTDAPLSFYILQVVITTGLWRVRESNPWTPVWTPIQLMAADKCAGDLVIWCHTLATQPQMRNHRAQIRHCILHVGLLIVFKKDRFLLRFFSKRSFRFDKKKRTNHSFSCLKKGFYDR